MRTLTASAAAVAVTLPFLGGLAATPAAAATTRSPQLDRLSTVMRAPAILARSTMVSRVSGTATIKGALALKPRNEATLAQFISSVTTKGSATFHQYLTRGEFAHRFGPTTATIAAVKSALAHDGLHVDGVSANRLLVSFSASASKVESAFHTRLANFRLPDGTIGRATTSAVKLPASLASKVSVVAGLDNLVREAPAGILRATKQAAAGHPKATAPKVAPPAGAASACASAQGAATAFGGLTDNQIANAYGAFPLYKAGDFGQGQSIAVYELEAFSRSDLKTFDQCYFGTTVGAQMANSVQVTSVDGGQPAGPGSGEAILDVSDVSAMAPKASINVYEAPNTTFGALDEYNQIIANDAQQIVTSSWGLCEAAVQQGEPGFQQAENAIFMEAAAQGQSVFSAAGDTGSNDCNAFRTTSPVSPVLSVDDPASQPYVVSVGGTTIDAATQPPQEHVWNDGAAWGAGGGGVSSSWVMPSWQYGLVGTNAANQKIVANAAKIASAYDGTPENFCAGNPIGASAGAVAGQPCRQVPDVSAQADEFTGAVTIYSSMFGPGSQGWITIGGTSSATPIWASMLAEINASPTCQQNGLTNGVGFVSPLLYAIGANPTAYAASFNDITSGNNDIYDIANGTTFPATKGYDMASGLGSPQLTSANGGPGLAQYACSYGEHKTAPGISAITPSVFPVQGTGTTAATITGTGFENSSGAPDVSSIWVNNYLLTGSGFTVTSATSISVKVPDGSLTKPPGAVSDGAGPAVVTVSLSDGQTSLVGPHSVIDYVDTSAGSSLPAVTGVSAYGGPQAGGNTVTILGSGFEDASGSPSVTSVTFGGAPATSFKVTSAFRITATVPAYSTATSCAPTGTSPSTDVCQVQVVVTNASGSSNTYPILQPYSGAFSFNANGIIPAPSGCNCEVAPAPSEYDYYPAPTVTSISTSSGPAAYASEAGGTLVTIKGSGFDLLGLEGVYFGPPTEQASLDTNFVAVTPTTLVIAAPAEPQTINSTTFPVSVGSLGGTSSGSKQAIFAGVPAVTAVTPPVAPSTGGQQLNVSGNGFSDVLVATFTDVYTPFSVASDYALDVASNRQVVLDNPAQNPAVVNLQLCTASGCSAATPANQMVIYPPGNPIVTGSSPSSGPAHGGTKVTISGHNLGCVTAVYFGSKPARTFSNAPALLDCGSTRSIQAVAPAGRPGSTVHLTVKTLESTATGYGKSKATAAATFTYKPSSPSAPRITHHYAGPDSVTVRWMPPTQDGGAQVSSYVVRAEAKGMRGRVRILRPGARSWRFTHLYAGATWTIWVTAHNSHGAGLSTTIRVRPHQPKKH